MNTESSTTSQASQSKCYRWYHNPTSQHISIDRYRRCCDGSWEIIAKDGKVSNQGRDLGFDDRVRTGLFVEVPDAPLGWPLIDGKPINPEGFPALYRACKKALAAIGDIDDRVSNLQYDVFVAMREAVALSDNRSPTSCSQS